MKSRAKPAASAISTSRHAALTVLLAGWLFLVTACPVHGQPNGNFIMNGGFETFDAPNMPANWNVNSNDPQVVDFPTMEGNSFCALNQHPFDPGWSGSFRAIDQFLQDFFASENPEQVNVDAHVAIPPGSQATIGTIRLELHLFGSGPVIIREIPLIEPNVPDDGEFHPVMGRLDFSPNYFSENNINQAYFAITKFGPGPILVDNLSLGLGGPPREFTVSPDFGSTLGGRQVTISSSDPINEPFFIIGDQGADVIERQSNQVTVLSPPANVPGPADIQLLNPDGTGESIPDGFTYHPPLEVHGISPNVLPPEPNEPLHIMGSGFVPGTEVRIGGELIPPTDTIIQPEIIELNLVSIAPISIGTHEIQVDAPDGQMIFSTNPLQVFPSPVIVEVRPLAGIFSGVTYIEIHGENFSQGWALGYLDGQALTDLNVVSDQLITGYTPPNPAGMADLHLDFADGLKADLPDAFEYLQTLPGDYDGNNEVTATDYRLFSKSLFDNSLDPGNPSADVNGDGRLDLLDAHTVFLHSANPNRLQHSGGMDPELIIPGPYPPPGFPLETRVRNLGFNAPAVIHWGDGFHSNVAQDSVVTHTYDEPGTYNVIMETEHSTTDPQAVMIPNPNPVRISSIDLSLDGLDIDANPIEGRSAQLDPVIPPPELRANLTGSGSGTVHGTLFLDSSSYNADLALPFSAEFPAEPAGEKSVQISLGDVPRNPGESHIISVEINHGADVEPEVTGAMPVTIQVPDFVTEEDCRELERQWKALVAAKAAKKADCEALQKQLDKLKEDLADKEAEKPVKEQDLQDCKDQRDSLEEDLQDRIDDMNAFLSPNATVQTYMGQGDFPPGSNLVGAKRNGSATGVGMSFGDANEALGDIDNYEGATGGDFGADMAEMRQWIKDLENLDEQIENKEEGLDDLNSEIDDLKNNKIPDKEQELADCKAMCDTLEQQIEDIVAANEECLKQLEEQRKAENAIRGAERAGNRAQNKADRVGGNADGAENLVGGRGGSPSEVADDEADVAEAKACQEQAQDLIDDGKELLRLARSALAQGNTESANSFRTQAEAKFEAAEAKLDEAQDHINTANANARSRKRRDCPKDCEGLDRITEEEYKVYTHVTDVSVVLMGYTPKSWATFNDAVQEAISGLDLVSNIAELGGDYSPIGGAITPDVGRAATAIVGAYTNYASRLGLDVYIKHRGHCEIKRTIHRCVNGCWEFVRVESERIGGTFEDSLRIGSIPENTPKEERAAIVQQLLSNYHRSMRVVRKSTPTTSKAQ